MLYSLHEVLYKKYACPPDDTSPGRGMLFANALGNGIGTVYACGAVDTAAGAAHFGLGDVPAAEGGAGVDDGHQRAVKHRSVHVVYPTD